MNENVHAHMCKHKAQQCIHTTKKHYCPIYSPTSLAALIRKQNAFVQEQPNKNIIIQQGQTEIQKRYMGFAIPTIIQRMRFLTELMNKY